MAEYVFDSDTYINQAGFRDSFIDDDFTPHSDTILRRQFADIAYTPVRPVSKQ